ncbi:MAG: DUF2807 domain-containing protein [Alphaproteobacteria bacterium]|nr:DUF2807 domain-containing protein [Alphaproteobacteria bacterium]
MSLFLKLGLVGVAAGIGGVASLSQLNGVGMASTSAMPSLTGLASLVGIGATAAGSGGPVDQTFAVRRVHIDKMVAQVELVTIPQGPVRVQASGLPDTMKEFHVRAVGDEVIIRLDKEEEDAWFPWNLFNMWSHDRKVNDLKLRISAPLGTPYDIEDMVGSINAGDLDAPLRLDGSSLTARFGRVQSAKVSVAGSGRITVGAIKETLDLEIAGSGRFEAPSAAAAQIEIAGGGDVILGPLVGGLSAEIAGSGDVRAAQINGPVDIEIAGSGGVIIDGGRATSFSVDIAGSGDVLFKGEAVNPDVSIAGSGDVKVGSYSGHLSQEIIGSGKFEVMNPGSPQQPAPAGSTPPVAPLPPAAPKPPSKF